MFLDAHLHLQRTGGAGKSAAFLRDRALETFGPFFSNAVLPADWPLLDALAQEDSRIVPFYGVHPWCADRVEEGWQASLERRLETPNAGVGEIGLDRARESVDFSVQKNVFGIQLELAAKAARPCAIHCVRSWGELLEMIRPVCREGRARLMVHAFRGSAEILRELISLGVYISFSRKGLRHLNEETATLVCAVPEDRLLVETDYPYPEPGEGGEADPASYARDLRGSYEAVAAARNIPVQNLAEAVLKNGQAFLHGTHPR